MALPILSKLELQIMETLWRRGVCSVREIQEKIKSSYPEGCSNQSGIFSKVCAVR
jgi:predicted transcriptional regulator